MWKMRNFAPAAAALLLVAGVVAVHPAPAVAASNDLFVDLFGDAMDFANPEDVAITPNTTYSMANATISDGQFHADLTGAAWLSLLWPGFGGALPHGREGAARPADASRYNRLVARLNVTAPQPMIALWHTCAVADASCQGGTITTLQPGWQTVDVALQSTPSDRALSAPWAGQIHGLRLLFPQGSGHVDVDWARVTADSGTVAELSDRSTPSFDAALDYATNAGNGWDFSDAADVVSVGGVQKSSVSGGVLSACNAPVGAATGDPNVVLRLPGGPINAGLYHRLVVSMRYDGPFSLSSGAGGGSLLRVVWRDTAGTRHVSRDIVTYPNEPVIVADLRTNPPGAVSEDGAPWSGMVTELRIDPNEDAGGRCWTIDRVLLLADAGADLGARPGVPVATTPATSRPTTGRAPTRKPVKRPVPAKKRR